MGRFRIRSIALAGVSTVLLALAAGAAAPGAAADGAPALNPRALSTLPSPFVSGHAGLYGWGAATMPDGSVIIGDYWNHQVVHFSTSGTFLGVMFKLAASPSVYSTPYGLAVDPNTRAIYVGFECCAVEKFSPNSHGVYLNPKRILHTGFSYPSRVAVGRDGTLYVSDMTASKIFVFNSAGTYQKSWGSLGSGTSQLNGPTSIALDHGTPQNLYIADPGNHRIDVINTSTGAFGASFGSGHLGADLRGVAVDDANGFVYIVDDSTGTVHQFALSGGAWISDIGSPWTLAQGNTGRTCCAPGGKFANGGREATVDGLGQLWVGDMPDFRVQVFDSSGNLIFLRYGTPVGAPTAAFNGPHGVALDPTSGALIVADTYNFRIQEFNAAGTWQWAQGMRDDITTQYGLNYPMGVVVEPATSAILVVDSFNNAIRKYDSNGNWIWTYTGAGTLAHTLNHPDGIALGPTGTIYVADSLKKRVVKITDAGTSAKWLGSIACTCFKQPTGVAVDASTGNVFVSDLKGADVVEFNTSGVQMATIGGALSSQPLQNPTDVVVDGTYAYVSDSTLNQVLIYSESNGASQGVFGGTGSGSAQLSQPMALALNGSGDIYVADSGNDRISEWCVLAC